MGTLQDKILWPERRAWSNICRCHWRGHTEYPAGRERGWLRNLWDPVQNKNVGSLLESSTELLNGGKTALNQPDLVAHIGLAVRQNEILSGRGGGKGRWGAEDISLQTRATHSLRRSKGETGRDRNIWGDGKAIWVDLLSPLRRRRQ